MRKKTAFIIQAFFLSTAIGGNLIFTGQLKSTKPALHERNSSGLSTGGSTALRQSYQESFPDYDKPSERRRCPLCDKSVFPYCGDKLFHDACCCTDPYQYPLPHKCRLADCAFLHANSCQEHWLISDCCCSDEYRSLTRGLDLRDPTAAPDTTTTVKN